MTITCLHTCTLKISAHTMRILAGTVVGRTKILVFGGVKGELAASDVSILNTDNMKWLVPQVRQALSVFNMAHSCTSRGHTWLL